MSAFDSPHKEAVKALRGSHYSAEESVDCVFRHLADADAEMLNAGAYVLADLLPTGSASASRLREIAERVWNNMLAKAAAP